MMARKITTTILVMSDTHGESISRQSVPKEPLDLVIHCGDLTQHSKLSEFRKTIDSLAAIKATLKIIIAGNHDFSLDAPVLCKKIEEAKRTMAEGLDDALLEREYGKPGEAQQLVQSARREGIVFLEEGNHTITLDNGASVKIYASPYTPSAGGEWGFQYNGEHDFNIDADCDIAITHGPPRGIMDMTEEKTRIGCPGLFKAIAKVQPKLHCFGHVHAGWGARFVSWRSTISGEPSHFTAIDNAQSRVIATLSKWKAKDQKGNLNCIESPPLITEDTVESEDTAKPDITIKPDDIVKTDNIIEKGQITVKTSHKSGQQLFLEAGKTLFVNAANMGDARLDQPFWLVDLELSAGSRKRARDNTEMDDRYTINKKTIL